MIIVNERSKKIFFIHAILEKKCNLYNLPQLNMTIPKRTITDSAMKFNTNVIPVSINSGSPNILKHSFSVELSL